MFNCCLDYLSLFSSQFLFELSLLLENQYVTNKHTQAAGSKLKNTHPAVFQVLIKPLTQEIETYKI